MLNSKSLGVLASLLALSSVVVACDSDDDAGSGTPCTPEGTYTLEKSVYTGSDGFCVTLAQELNEKAKVEEVACTKLDATTYETRNPGEPGDTPKRHTLDAAKCELNSSRSQSFTSTSSGRSVSLIIDLTSTAKVSPTGLDGTGTARVSTTSAGVNGLPCSLTVAQKATKK